MNVRFSLKEESFFIALLGVFIFSFSLETVWQTKIYGNNVLLPEIVFCIISPIILIKYLTYDRVRQFFKLAFVRILLVYVGLVLLSFIISQKSTAFGEFIASVYAIAILFVVFLIAWKNENSEKILKFLIYSGVVASILSILGFLLGQLFNINYLNTFFPHYPMTGDTYRGHGLIRGPMIASDLMCVSMLVLLQNLENNKLLVSKSKKIFILILSLGLLSTLTKSILILIGLILLFYPVRGKFKIFYRYLGGLIILAYLIMSHFLIKKNTSEFHQYFKNSPYSSNTYYQITDNYLLVPTIYSTQKYISIKAGLENFPFGIGGNYHMKYAQKLFEDGVVSANVTLAPHSTYFGAFGELGIFGLIAVCSMYYLAYTYSKNYCLGQYHMILAFIILSGVTIDNMNLRHHWVIFGVLLGCTLYQNYSSVNRNEVPK